MTQAPHDQRLEAVNVHTVMEKVASKRDVYNLLSQEGEAYLPKMDSANIYFLKDITRGRKDVSAPVPDPAVHQAVSSEGGSSPSDRGSQSRGLPEVCAEEARPDAVPPGREGLEPPGQEVGVRRPLHQGPGGHPVNDQLGDRGPEEEAGEKPGPHDRDEARVPARPAAVRQLRQ